MMLLGSELFFIVTNSDATAEYRNEPPQNLSSGLFNSWVNEDSDEYQKIYDEASCHKLPFMGEEEQAKNLSEFFDKVLEDTVLV